MKKNTAIKTRFLLSLLIVALLILFFDRFGFLNGIKSGYDNITSPIQQSFTNINQQILAFEDTISNLNMYKSELDLLEAQIVALKEKQVTFDELVKENDTLRNQLGLKLQSEKILLESNIINFSDYNSPDYIVINIGEDKQIKKGDIVVSGKYAVGIVTNVESNTSEVELVSSKDTSVAVENVSGTAKGVLKKDNKNRLLMTLILPEEQIAKDDEIITSGLNSPYPYGLIIGNVSAISKSANNFNVEAEVDKYLDFLKLNKVFVIH